MKNISFIVLFLLISIVANGQERKPLDSVSEKYVRIEGDSIFQSSIGLEFQGRETPVLYFAS